MTSTRPTSPHCFVLTLIISLATKRTKPDAELKGHVYSLTPKQAAAGEAWYAPPAFLGLVLLAGCIILLRTLGQLRVFEVAGS